MIAVAATATIVVGSASPSPADNEVAFAANLDANSITATRAVQQIRTNPAVDPGVTVAHPFQVYFAGNAFYAVGTHKGARTAGVQNCAANPTGQWSGYVDGESPAGDYFCLERNVDGYGPGDNVNLRMEAGVCGASDGGWEAFLDGQRVSCKGFFNGQGQGVGAGLEAASGQSNLPDRSYNIDVYHTGVEVRTVFTAPSWLALSANRSYADREYRVTRPSASRIDTWFGVRD